jgi:hypothetical protein
VTTCCGAPCARTHVSSNFSCSGFSLKITMQLVNYLEIDLSSYFSASTLDSGSQGVGVSDFATAPTAPNGKSFRFEFHFRALLCRTRQSATCALDAVPIRSLCQVITTLRAVAPPR